MYVRQVYSTQSRRNRVSTTLIEQRTHLHEGQVQDKTKSRRNKIDPRKSDGAFYVRYPELPELDAASCFFLGIVECFLAVALVNGGDRASHSIFYLSSIAIERTSKNDVKRKARKKPLCDYFKSSQSEIVESKVGRKRRVFQNVTFQLFFGVSGKIKQVVWIVSYHFARLPFRVRKSSSSHQHASPKLSNRRPWSGGGIEIKSERKACHPVKGG
jgi:hypothetical protein